VSTPDGMIEAKDVGHTYATVHGTVRAIHGVSFSAAKGEFLAILGPSGCGKTTLLKIIGDLVEPTEGSVTVNGISAHDARIKGMFSYVFQNPVLLPWRRVKDNVALPLEILHRESRSPADMLRMVGLEGCENLYPKELSGGMQQRVALARALTFDPQVLLLDEPFGALDELTRNTLNLELLRIWQEIGVTTFLVTHSISEAAFLADRILVLSARPAKVEQLLEVPFKRPRETCLRESDDFLDLMKCLREKLN